MALDAPRALLAALGGEILEFRVQDQPERALSRLRQRGLAGADAFAIGARITVPLHGRPASTALAEIEAEPLRVAEMATRAATLDDVYLQRTGAELPQAA